MAIGGEPEEKQAHFYLRYTGVAKWGGSYPYRDCGLIEFYKMVSELGDIVAIEIDVESHSISLIMEAGEGS